MKRSVLFCCLTLALTLSHPASARQMYRYLGEDGRPVVAYQVPPDMVHRGYEVLNDKGVVIQVVPRTLDDRERASQTEAQRSAAEAALAAEAQRKWDESLLLRYSTVADIEEARDRALREQRISLSILRGKQSALRQQVENFQATAADLERRGVAVPAENLQNIRDLRAEIASTDRAIGEREEAIELVEADFARDIARFEELSELVRLRRSLSSGERLPQ